MDCDMTALAKLLLVVFVNFDFGSTMKTAPPDEIIEMLTSGYYNKHHLPTYSANKTKTRKTLCPQNGWSLTIEHDQTNDFERIHLIEEDKAPGHRLSMSRAVTSRLLNYVDSFMSHYVDGEHEMEDAFAYANHSTSYDAFDGQYLSEDVGTEIRMDSERTYTIQFSRQNHASKMLHIKEVRGRIVKGAVSIPLRYWGNVSEVLLEFQDNGQQSSQGPPTNVTIAMYIEGMSSFRAQTMDFHVDIYFSETWADPRLRHSSKYPALLRDMSYFERMWHPDLYFANAKEARYHTVTAPNFLVYIFPNGSILLDIRISLVVNCMMDLSHYPLDQQECFMRILSYAYDKDNLNIMWKSFDNITINPDIILPDMDLVNYVAEYCNGTYAIGVWACSMARFKMKREVMHHVLQSYIPTALIVVISWFSFWLDVDAVPGRVSLCITTLLTLATQAQAAKMSLPQVAYAKAIDVWMGTSMGFVFGVMIEFTVVNYISRRTSKTTANTSKSKRSTCRVLTPTSSVTSPQNRLAEFHNLLFDVTSMPEDPRFLSPQLECNSVFGTPRCQAKEPNGCARQSLVNREQSLASYNSDCKQEQNHIQQQQAKKNRKLAITVDRVSRFIFPCSFILFNMLYWPYYLLPRM